jgi:hypothetical protein
MDARLDFYCNAVAGNFTKRINAAGAVITGSTLPVATQELVSNSPSREPESRTAAVSTTKPGPTRPSTSTPTSSVHWCASSPSSPSSASSPSSTSTTASTSLPVSLQVTTRLASGDEGVTPPRLSH